MDILRHDIRYAARQLLRAPAFTIVATLTIGLGIGATTAMYSVVDAVLVRPLPFKDPGQLVRVGSTDRDGAIAHASPLDLADYRSQSHTVADLVPIKEVTSVSMQRDGHETAHLTWARVGAGFFSLLGVPAQLGRTFATGDDARDALKVAVLSDATWRREFGADPLVIGRAIRLADEPYTIVGVAPAWFKFPDTPSLWVPYVFAPWEIAPGGRSLHEIFALGRMRAGVTIESARQDLQTVARRLEQRYPTTNKGYGASLEPLKGQVVGHARRALLAMLGAVVLVLLIACANVANLLLVRATARRTEIAVRTALGASRRRVIRQLMTESALLSIAGFGVGTLFALSAVGAVVAVGPRGLPRLDEIAVNFRVLLCTACVAIGTGMLFGLVPALHATRTDLASSLRRAGPRAGRGTGKQTRSALVVAEFALAVVLLVGAGLLVRSFARLVQVDPGFRADQVLAFDLTLTDDGYAHDAQRNAFANTLIERLRALPGTEDVGVASARPFETLRNFSITTTFAVVGQPPPLPGKEPDTELLPVSSGYFHALGVPLIAGRAFTEGESRRDGPPVVVVNQAFVQRYFPNESPLGKQIVLGITHDTGATQADTATSRGEIVGVVGNVKELSLADAVGPRTYLPYGSLPFGVSVVIRTSADPAPLFRTIRSVVRDIDPNVAVYDLTTLGHSLDASVAQPRFYAVLLGGFAAIALVLAALGIYGVISYAVSQRTSEFGIRLALGATPGRLLRLVLGGGMSLTAAGVVIGLLGAMALTRVISTLLFGIEPIDPLTYTGVIAALFGVAILACWIPARRAARVDSAIAMRVE
jgi:predicted permease